MEFLSKSKMSVLASLQITVPFGYGVKGFCNSGAQHGARTLSSRISYSSDWKSACLILTQFPPGIVKMDSITGEIRKSGPTHPEYNTDWKEIYALLAACSTWDKEETNPCIIVCCHNMAVVERVKWRTSESPPVTGVLRDCCFMCAGSNFILSFHSCFLNSFTGCLPYFRVQVFRVLALQAHVHHHPKHLPTYRASKKSRLCFCAIEHWSMFAAMDTLLCNFALLFLCSHCWPHQCAGVHCCST